MTKVKPEIAAQACLIAKDEIVTCDYGVRSFEDRVMKLSLISQKLPSLHHSKAALLIFKERQALAARQVRKYCHDE